MKVDEEGGNDTETAELREENWDELPNRILERNATLRGVKNHF